MISPLRFSEPITKISNVNLGKPVTLEIKKGVRICSILLDVTVTVSNTGAATQSIPLPSSGIGEIRLNINGDTNRRRTAAQLFGAQGLNALNDKGNAGTVQYFQAGAVITAASGGITVGTVPVLIGSPEDVVLKAKLATNTATVAVFNLPLIFAEDFRKEFDVAEAMALCTAFDNGNTVGPVVVEMDILAATGVAGTMTAVAVSADLEYDRMVARAGSQVMLSKEKVYNKQYSGAGDIEVGDQLTNKERLMRVSLVTTADQISKVVVKQGSTVIKNVSFAANQAQLRKCGYNGAALVANRFDIEFDVNDDPNSSLLLDPAHDLSIVATLATANDAVKNITILPTYFGAIE